ncbi:PKD-like domain-containing protein [Flavobacterium algicola]|uniref:PKD-like domain-containing protein n=1 Tax=Flavobacterium algicola TaxID=556529 RepID=UPI001EFE875B|nr:PKD-like domain-containing protein [Flavobacterium algicola]MCG9791296.1 PKD domain-containing protein [Flavobacterium algicola]
MKKIIFALSLILSLTACSEDEIAAPEISITEPTGGFAIDKMKWLRIQPEVKNSQDITYSWLLDGTEVAMSSNFEYVFAAAGTHTIQLTAKNAGGITTKTFMVTVNEQTYINKITKVFEYLPAPGQFINVLPIATTDDTAETMRVKAEEKLTANSMITLGGFGGYVIFGFDHTVINKEGNDFIVLGNAFANNAEPGIIMVSNDANGNGLADDEWYEIAGSEYNKDTTIKNYEITYYKPATEPANASEPNYIKWVDNQGQTGYLSKNAYHKQTYYPSWKGETLTLKGTFLKSTMAKTSYWITPAYEFGYADNWSNTDAKSQIDISWAVDKDGKAVQLKGIDFVKVYNSNRAENSSTGEQSTEVAGFKDLNI